MHYHYLSPCLSIHVLYTEKHTSYNFGVNENLKETTQVDRRFSKWFATQLKNIGKNTSER